MRKLTEISYLTRQFGPPVDPEHGVNENKAILRASSQSEAFMKGYLRLLRREPALQQRFAFLVQSSRHERWFKLGVIGLTLLAIAATLTALPAGRYLVSSVPHLARRAVQSTLALPTPRAEIDLEWLRFRRQGIALSQRGLIRNYEEAPPAFQALF